MANFFEIKIPVRKDEGWNEWAKEMRSKIKAAGIPVRWQMFHYHMTLLFLDDDNCIEDLNQEFEQCMSVFYSFPITIDKLDAFTTGDGASHIIYLTSSQVPSQILTLAEDARTLADSMNANYDKRPFKPHVTLGRVPADKVSLEQLQSVLHRIEQPVFGCILNEAEHRYFRGDKIKTWKLKYGYH